MKPAPFKYHAPRSLEEALSLLAEYGYDAKALAGGQSLVPVMNFRLAQPGVLIDLNKRGRKTGIVILTEGEMGTGGTPEIRQKELLEAADLLGSDVIKVFDWGDTQLEDSYEKRLELAAIIRACQPKVLLAPYPHVGHGRRQSHADHVAAGVITINAANLAALKKAPID